MHSAPPTRTDRTAEQPVTPTSAFLRACRGIDATHTPVWFMRQAGRYMDAYQEVRAKHSLQQIMLTPELATQVTLQPVEAFGVDAAVIFTDILWPLVGMGLDLNIEGDAGPNLTNSLQSAYDIDLLATPPAEEYAQPVLDAVRLSANELAKRDIPLIGIGGAPFTLAVYAIEGGATRTFIKTKALMYSEPAAWRRLMNKLVTVTADYLVKQVSSGAQAVQVFDSWLGLALSREDYLEYVHPYNQTLYQQLERTGTPVINFSTGTAAYIADVAVAGGDVVSVDWRMPLDWYWNQIEHDRPVQGNLDPIALFAPWRELRYRIDKVLEQAGDRNGHIFSLGHGILPDTSEDVVRRVVEYVHEHTIRA